MARTVFAITAILVPILTFLLDAVEAHYTPTWAVHVPGGKEAADAVATEYGFINLGEIINNHYHFHHNGVSKRSLSPAHAHHGQLAADDRVRWVKQQKALSRKKRDFVAMSTAEALSSWAPEVPSTSSTKREVSWRREQQSARLKARPRSADTKFQLNDPKWPHMWYLNRGGGLDMNVIPAWREGITGRGVVVTILDDGLETDHPDLVANYDPMASYDVNSHDSDPQPRYDLIDSNRHGTRCAGEVAATSNNSLCAVGVAFGARVGGVRMLDGDVTDAVEARSLSLNPQHVDIYSASWGPDDDGKTVDGPGELATRAFIEGVTKGRNGKGSIFVWASGNGGREQDNCNCDGYTNSIWTLSISSATERGEVPWYSEMCSSTLAATYSSGAINEKQIVTTDLHHSCTSGHTGTSASAPLAAGICALALQANRDLTWRDMQHIVVRTARPERLSANGHWHTNGVGRNVSHSFGYGLLDAAGMVRLARSWRTVPPQRRCELAAPRSQQRNVPPKSTITLQLDVTSCPGVNFLEHVQARVSLAAARRGDLRITLTSPAGTTVVLLAPRSHDSSRAGFTSWPFMSVHMWGESPMGVWQLQVYNEGRFMAGPLSQWEMIFYGTETPPQETYSQETNGLDQSSTWSGAAKEAAGGQDVEHNALDDDLALVWHDSQTIRDEGQALDHQQPTPKTNGCSRISSQPTHHCLECAKGFHLFDGRCYAQCPNGTFASEMDTSRGSRRRNGSVFTEAMVKRHPGERFSEADDMSAPLVCAPCHYTCPICSGPESYQCLACADDAVLFNTTSGPDREPRHYCYPSSILPQIDNNKQGNTNTFVVVALFVVTSVSLYFILACILKRWCFVANMRSGEVHSNLGYVKLQNSENQQKAHDIENEVRQAIVNSTDSESDEDLHL